MKDVKRLPRCSRVVLVEPTRTTRGHTVFKFSTDAAHATTGFIERDAGDNGIVVWRPYIRSSTQSGYWNAGPMRRFIEGYKSEEDALTALLDEAQEVFGAIDGRD